MDWGEKYRPMHLQDIVGNTTVIRQMAAWAKDWTRQSRPLLLYGKPGIGKTSSAYALARDMGWEAIELNASDQRTAAVIERVAGAGSTTASLTGASRKLIILDEADNLQGTADRGGARAILECIKESRQPMILIANDLYGIPPEIRARCDPLQFRAITAHSIVPRLKSICASEQIACEDTAIRQIADSAEGDMRSAVNMLFASSVGREHLGDSQVQTARKDERISIFTLISALAVRKGDEDLLRLSRELDDTPETIEQWIEGNLTLIVPPENIRGAYRHLSRADEYLGYTYRRQYHTLWRYATALMLLGVADESGGRGIHARIMPPARWQKMAGAKRQKAIRSSVLARVAGMMHIPSATLHREYLSTITLLVESDPAGFAGELMLDADQLNFFLSDRSKSQSVIQRVTKAAKEREKEKEAFEKKEKAEKARVRRAAESPQKKDNLPDINEIALTKEAPDTDPSEKKPPAKSQSTLFDGF
ncbi:MAG: Replication factor C large subunit [Methanoregula sp. PtaU1.Bin051]|nr:MAG: Replication factor C large subunit [Methanoregula sp. PtaU1.Bin051]